MQVCEAFLFRFGTVLGALLFPFEIGSHCVVLADLKFPMKATVLACLPSVGIKDLCHYGWLDDLCISLSLPPFHEMVRGL